MNILTYKGFAAAIEFDAEDMILTGRLAGINDIIGFHADSGEGLVAAFREAVDDYIETCARVGKEPEKPYSGKMMLRVDPAIHARVAMAAQLLGTSLNQWSEEVLGRAAEQVVEHAVAA